MNNILKTVKHWLGWILRPGLAYRRIRERKWVGAKKEIRTDLPLENLPLVVAVLAKTPEQLQEVLGIYQRCPSELVKAPRSMAKLKEHIAKSREFYLIKNEAGENVAAIGYNRGKDMMGYLAVEYRYRRGGIGLAASLAIQELKRSQGLRRINGQILRKNTQYLSTTLSLGWQIDEENSTEEYYTIYLDFPPEEEG